MRALEDGVSRRSDRPELAPRATQRLVGLRRDAVVGLVVVVQLADERQVLRVAGAVYNKQMISARHIRV